MVRNRRTFRSLRRIRMMYRRFVSQELQCSDSSAPHVAVVSRVISYETVDGGVFLDELVNLFQTEEVDFVRLRKRRVQT